MKPALPVMRGTSSCTPALEPDCEFTEGDAIEMVEGFFVLNDDLNPMQMAMKEPIQKARQSP